MYEEVTADQRQIVSRWPSPARSRAMGRSIANLHSEITAAQKSGRPELVANLTQNLIDLSIAWRPAGFTMPTGDLSGVA